VTETDNQGMNASLLPRCLEILFLRFALSFMLLLLFSNSVRILCRGLLAVSTRSTSVRRFEVP
jgi:hypothetical protein